MLVLISVLGSLLYNCVYFLSFVFVVQFVFVVGRTCLLQIFSQSGAVLIRQFSKNCSRLWRDSAFFFRTRIRTWSQKFVKNRTRIWSHFSISAAAGVCEVISQVKTWVNYGWIDDCSQSLNRSGILNFEKLPDPIPD